MSNIKNNIDEHLCVAEGEHIIPNKFSSIEQLLKGLNRFMNMIKTELPHIEANFDGENTDYKIVDLCNIAFDVIHMVERCNKAYIYDESLTEPYQNMRILLCQGNIDGFLEQLSSVLSTIPKGIRKKKMNEAYFHIMVHTILVTIGFDVLSENQTNIGSIDLTINFPEVIYIFEFKYSQDSKDLSDKALQQIKDKDYCNRFKYHLKTIRGIGVSFGEMKKNINGYKEEILYQPSQDLLNRLHSRKA